MAHIPVLLNEVLEVLNPQPNEKFIDGTIGSGGHALEILERILPNGRLLGLDLDKNLLELAESKIRERFKKNLRDNQVTLVNDSFTNLPAILKENKFGKADGLLLDLGFSSWHLEKSGRGFSFLKDEPLDMRYSFSNIPRMKTNMPRMTAEEVINTFNERELAEIFWKYGDERFSRRIARKIIEERKRKQIRTTFDLVAIIKKAVPGSYERGRIHPATRTFLALRIFINAELENLKKVLADLPKILKVGARVAIISFNSLEDRIVKQIFKETQKSGLLRIITKKPLRPSREEIIQNPRSRSAKLRAAIVKGLV